MSKFGIDKICCNRCIFWYPNSDYSKGDLNQRIRQRKINKGRCIRFPPQIIPLNHIPVSTHPSTNFFDYCGEFQLDPRLKKEVKSWGDKMDEIDRVLIIEEKGKRNE